MNRITIEECISLSQKDPQELTDMEYIKMKKYKEFFRYAKKNVKFVSEDVIKFLNEYDVYTRRMQEKPAPLNQENDLAPTLSLKKAGYINASVILIILLNIGFIVGITLFSAISS